MITTLGTALPEQSLKSLAETVGTLPGGDVPKAWYMSLEPEVLTQYERWRVAHEAWRDRVTELMEQLGTDPKVTRIAHLGEDTMVGLYLPDGDYTWWRQEKKRGGYWVPRKRTKAEKSSEQAQRFAACRRIPLATRYLPGMPHSIWEDHGLDGTVVWPVKFRRPAKAVLAFTFGNPAQSSPPFEVGPQWTQMKLSIYHALRERQEATGG